MDKITNCPENVDRQTWQQMCNLRREKIQLEEDLRILGIYFIKNMKKKLPMINVYFLIRFVMA